MICNFSCDNEISKVLELKDGRLVSISKINLLCYETEELIEVTESIDAQIVFWDQNTLDCIRIITSELDLGSDVFYLSNEDLLFIPSSSVVYNINTYQLILTLKDKTPSEYTKVIKLENESVLVFTRGNKLLFYSEKTFKCIKRIEIESEWTNIMEYEKNCFVYSTKTSNNVFVLNVNNYE